MKPFKRNNETHLIYWVEWECHNYENISTNQLLSCTTMQSWINKGSDVHMSRLLTKLLVGSQIPLQPLEKKNHSLLLLWWVYVCTCCDILTTWGLCSATRSHRTSGQKNGKILHYILLLISENYCVNKSTKYLLTVYLLCFIFHINGFESWLWILIYMHILDGLHYTDIKVKENLEIHK